MKTNDITYFTFIKDFPKLRLKKEINIQESEFFDEEYWETDDEPLITDNQHYHIEVWENKEADISFIFIMDWCNDDVPISKDGFELFDHFDDNLISYFEGIRNGRPATYVFYQVEGTTPDYTFYFGKNIDISELMYYRRNSCANISYKYVYVDLDSGETVKVSL